MSESENPAGRSPLYEVVHASRYERQSLVRQIEQETGRRLIVYFSNNDPIIQPDVGPFQDLLYDCAKGCDIDLLIQSPGGDVDTAEKLVIMLRERARGFRVIVTERAKSAATMIALAADEILMSSTSELGPIDPQIQTTSGGGVVYRLAQSFLDGLEEIKRKAIEEGGVNPAYFPSLSQLDPALLDFCQKATQRSGLFAEKWLSRHMLKDDHAKAAEIAKKLVNVNTYSSHGMVIDWRDAQELGLNVTHMDEDDHLWRLLWRLYLFYEMHCAREKLAKVFEGNKVSLAF